MSAYNTKTEGVMRIRISHWWLLGVCLFLVPYWSQADDSGTRPSLAIMSLTNQNLDDPEWQWLSQGLADMITTDLARSRRFQVVDRETVHRYLQEIRLADTGLVDRDTALKLGHIASVQKALFGSYKVTNDQVAIQAYLIDVESNDVERVETVQGPVDEILSLEKTLALRIVENLNVPLTQEEIDSIKFKATDSLDAATRFYRGLADYDDGMYFDALRQFRLAEKADSTYDKPLLFQGHVLENLGEHEHAILAFRKMATQIPKSEFAADAWFIAAKLLANEFGEYDEALQIADRIIRSYGDSTIRDGTVIAEEYGPVPAIIVRGNYGYSLAAIMRLFKYSLYVRTGDFRSAMQELESSAEGTPEPYQHGNVHYLRQLVKFAYEQSGDVLIPAASPKVILLDNDNPVYMEDYSSGKRFRDSFKLESGDTKWGGEILQPYGYDEQTQQHYISNKYAKAKKQWMTTADKYLFAVPDGYVVDSVDVWLEGYQSQPWTLAALVVSVGDYNSKGASGGPRPGHIKDHYRAPVLSGTRLFELLIQVAGDFTKPHDQFAYISGWKIKANLRRVTATAALNITSNTNVLVFVDPIPGQVKDAESIMWRSNPSIDCPCRINNLPAGPHRLVAFATGKGGSVRRDGRRRELDVNIVPGQPNELAIDFPKLQVRNEAEEVLPGWGGFHHVLNEFTRVGAGGKVNQLVGLQSMDGSYQLLFTKDFDIWMATSVDGENWTEAARLPGPVNSQSLEDDLSIIQGEDGTYYMAFLSARGGSKALYVSRSRDLKRWQKPINIASLESLRGRPSLLQLQNGKFRVYFARRNHRVTYVASDDFVNWTEGTETKVPHQNFSQVVVDDAGKFWLLYGGYEDRDHLYFAAMSDDGDEWQDFSRVDESFTGHDLGSHHATLVPATGGGVAMAWQRTTRPAFSRSQNGSDWTTSSAQLESGGKLGYPNAPFAFFKKRDRSYMLVFPNAHDELWSATSRNPFQ